MRQDQGGWECQIRRESPYIPNFQKLILVQKWRGVQSYKGKANNSLSFEEKQISFKRACIIQIFEFMKQN